MWNREIELAGFAREFAARAYTVVPDALNRAAAVELLASINEITRRRLWYSALHGDPRYADLCNVDDARNFTYRFDKFPVANIRIQDIIGAARGDSRRATFRDALPVGERPEMELAKEHAIRRFGSALNGRSTAVMISRITGGAFAQNSANCFLSRYMSGDYLAAHDDGPVGDEGRRVAFVLNLTAHWLPHWGGHTVLFNDRTDRIATTVIPQFNSLLLFAVPMRHCVTAIAPTCPAPRYAITGWFHARSFGS